MRRIAIICLTLLCVNGAYSQKSDRKTENIKNATTSFNSFCVKEAIYYTVVPSQKENDLIVSGELESLMDKPNASYLDYGIELKENETQYFTLTGTDKVLVAKSLYLLRLDYTNSTK